MSTYRDDMLSKAKKVDSKLYAAMTRICFNQDVACLRNMQKALSLFSFGNTKEENQRLADVTYYLKNKHKLNKVTA